MPTRKRRSPSLSPCACRPDACVVDPCEHRPERPASAGVIEAGCWTLRLARRWRVCRVSHAQFLITLSGTVFDKKTLGNWLRWRQRILAGGGAQRNYRNQEGYIPTEDQGQSVVPRELGGCFRLHMNVFDFIRWILQRLISGVPPGL